MVSRETFSGREEFVQHIRIASHRLDRLSVYADLLVKWQAQINLVAESILGDLWDRHMLDSAQLAAHLPPGPIFDFGSGA